MGPGQVLVAERSFPWQYHFNLWGQEKDNLEAMKKSNADARHYPNGSRPFSQPSGGPDLDGPVQCTLASDYSFGFVIPKGASRAQALEMTYFSSIVAQKTIWF